MKKRYVNIEEISSYLGLSKNTIYSWIWQRRIPYLKMGRLVKFDLMAVEHWVNKNAFKPEEN